MGTAEEMTQGKKIEAIARVCHEANRAWCESHGDLSQFPWENAESWQWQSAIKGVQVALDGATPEQQHEAWCDAKRKDGWVFGEQKDPAQKTHPCLVAYWRLPDAQKAKDTLFGSIVRALAPSLGLEIVKND
jgi:hypothetical protein